MDDKEIKKNISFQSVNLTDLVQQEFIKTDTLGKDQINQEKIKEVDKIETKKTELPEELMNIIDTLMDIFNKREQGITGYVFERNDKESKYSMFFKKEFIEITWIESNEKKILDLDLEKHILTSNRVKITNYTQFTNKLKSIIRDVKVGHAKVMEEV